MTDKFTYPVAAHLLLIEEGKILMQRRYNTGYQDGNYSVPAGHVEQGETPREGCAREMREEIGINITPVDLTVVHVMHRRTEKDERVDFFLIPSSYTGEIKNKEPDKCDDLQFFPVDELPENTIEYIRAAVANYRNGIFYAEFGW